MRRVVATKSMALCLLLLVVTGCSQQPQQKSAEQVTVTERSPEQICASEDNRQSVKAIIVREAKEEAPGSEAVGDEALAGYLTIGPVVVELVEETTDRVTCSTDVSFSIPADLRGYYVQAAILANYLQRNGHAAWAASNGVDMGEEVPGELMKGSGGAVPITFSVQPTADRKSELVSVEGAGGLISAVATAAKALIAQEKVSQASGREGDPDEDGLPNKIPQFSEGTSYGVVRASLLQLGFEPVRASEPCGMRVCELFPELDKCVDLDMGECTARFTKNGQIIKVETGAGELQYKDGVEQLTIRNVIEPRFEAKTLLKRPYAEARPILLKQGFKPVPLPSDEFCGYGCNEAYPETVSCGGIHCKFEWRDSAGRKLTISTQGETTAAITSIEVR